VIDFCLTHVRFFWQFNELIYCDKVIGYQQK